MALHTNWVVQTTILFTVFSAHTLAQPFTCDIQPGDQNSTDFLFEVSPPDLAPFELVIWCNGDFNLSETEDPGFTVGGGDSQITIDSEFDGPQTITDPDDEENELIELRFTGTFQGWSNVAGIYDVRLEVTDANGLLHTFEMKVHVARTIAESKFSSNGRDRSLLNGAIVSAQEVLFNAGIDLVFEISNDNIEDAIEFKQIWKFSGDNQTPAEIDVRDLPGEFDTPDEESETEESETIKIVYSWDPDFEEAGVGYVFQFRPEDKANKYSDKFVAIQAQADGSLPTQPQPPTGGGATGDDYTPIYIVISAIVAFIILYIAGGCCYQYHVNGEARMPHAYFWAKLCPGCCMWTGQRDYLTSLDMDHMNEETTMRGRFVSTDSFLEYGSVPSSSRDSNQSEQPKLIL